LSEGCTTNGSTAARLAAVARGKKTARKAMVVMTTQPGCAVARVCAPSAALYPVSSDAGRAYWRGADPPRRADPRSLSFFVTTVSGAASATEVGTRRPRWSQTIFATTDRPIAAHPVDSHAPGRGPGRSGARRSAPRVSVDRRGRRQDGALTTLARGRTLSTVSGIILSGEIVNAPGTGHWRAVRRPR
jgi:hypothetical protein